MEYQIKNVSTSFQLLKRKTTQPPLYNMINEVQINHQVLTSLPKEALLSSTNVSTFLPLPWSGGSNLAEISTTPQYNHPRTWKACSVTIVPTMEVLITSEGPNGQMRSRVCEKGAGLWLTPSNLVSHHRYSLHCCHWDNNQLRVTVLY